MPLTRKVPLKIRNPKRWREIHKPDEPQQNWVCTHPDCTIFLAGHRMNPDLTFDSNADLDRHKSRANHWTGEELQEQRGLLPGTQETEEEDDVDDGKENSGDDCGRGKGMLQGKGVETEKGTEAGAAEMEGEGRKPGTEQWTWTVARLVMDLLGSSALRTEDEAIKGTFNLGGNCAYVRASAVVKEEAEKEEHMEKWEREDAHEGGTH